MKNTDQAAFIEFKDSITEIFWPVWSTGQIKYGRAWISGPLLQEWGSLTANKSEKYRVVA